MASDQPSSRMTRRQKAQADLDHLLKEVIQLDDDEPFYLVIESNRIRSIGDIVALSDDELSRLTYQDEEDNTMTIDRYSFSTARLIKYWSAYLRTTAPSFEWTDEVYVTTEEWDLFRTSIFNPDDPRNFLTSGQSVFPPSPSNASTTSSRSVSTPLSDFKRGIKRDKSHYETLKDEKEWDNWKRNTTSTAHTHGCENVLDPTYRPVDPAEIDLFQSQKAFLYDVFCSKMETSMGKFFVRKYEADRDAQAVWREYLNYMSSSTRAEVEIEDLMAFLTSSKIRRDYRGPTLQYITDWLDNLRKYESLTPLQSRFPDSMKKALLTSAVEPLKEFRDVSTHESIARAKGSPLMNFDAYVAVLQRVATKYDKSVGVTNRFRQRQPSMDRSQHKRVVQFHDRYDYDDEEDYPDPEDIDENSNSFSINNMHGRHSTFGNRPSLPRSVWRSLSREEQLAWDTLSDPSKSSILNATRSVELPPRDTTQNTSKDSIRKQQTVNNASVDDNEDFRDAHEEPVDHDDNPTPDSLLINAAAGKRNDLLPGDIRRVMSTQDSKNKKNPRVRTANVHSINSAGTLPVYSVSRRSQSSSTGGLVDRGANGGLAGTDMRTITVTDRRVDITGINNHQLQGLKIMTAGAVLPTQRGEVIGIFHQYASVPQARSIHAPVQLESFGITIDDRSKFAGGKQCIRTIDGYVLPLDFIQGLPYVPMRPFSDEEWDTLPHVVFTADVDWEPSVADKTVSDKETWFDAISDRCSELEERRHIDERYQ